MLTEGKNYPFTHLRAASHHIWWLVHTSSRIGTCIISADKKSITFQGTPVLMAKIPAWYQNLVLIAEEQLDRVLCRLKFPDFDELVVRRLNPSNPQDAFIDIHNNCDVGYSFVKEKKNGLDKYEGALLSAIFDDKELNLRFHSYDKNGEPSPQISEFHLVSHF